MKGENFMGKNNNERLTANDLNKVCYDPWELCGMDYYCKKGCHDEGGCTKGCHILKMYLKLAEYEDLEEQGRLLRLSESDTVDGNMDFLEAKAYIEDMIFEGAPVGGEIYRLPDPESEALKVAVFALEFADDMADKVSLHNILRRKEVTTHENRNK